METESTVASDLIDSDLREIGIAAKKLANHAIMLGGLGFGTSFLQWLASFAAMGDIGKWISLIGVITKCFNSLNTFQELQQKMQQQYMQRRYSSIPKAATEIKLWLKKEEE